jgi:hypothetical protein
LTALFWASPTRSPQKPPCAFLCSAPHVKQSRSAPHVKQSRSAPHVKQSRSAPHMQQSSSAPHVQQSKGRGGADDFGRPHRPCPLFTDCRRRMFDGATHRRLDAWTMSFQQTVTSGPHASWPTSANVSSPCTRAFRTPSWPGSRALRNAHVSATSLCCCEPPGCECRSSTTLEGRSLQS